MSTAITASNIGLISLPSSELASIPSNAPASKDEFDALTGLLDPAKKASVIEKIRTLDNKAANIDNVIKLANTHDFQSFEDFFVSPQFEYYALAGVQEKKISSMQFGTLMFVRAGLSEKVKIKDLLVVPLFNRDAPASDAWGYIESTLQSEFNSLPNSAAMDKHELSHFFEIMRTLPISEQYFVVIPDTRNLVGLFGPFTNISQAVNQDGYFNVFCGLEIQGKKMRMIPSLGMIKALLDATGTDGFTYKLVLGASTPNSLRHSIINENAREMCIHCDEIAPAPCIADGLKAPPLDFMYHDLYHIWLCRLINKKHRQFFCELADVVNPDKYANPAAKRIAGNLYASLVDLEMTSYRPDINDRPIDIEEASNTIIKYEFKLADSKRKRFLASQKNLTTEEQQESDIIFNEIKDKIICLFAIWKLHKKNYKNFKEIIDFYDSLDPQLQRQTGIDFFKSETIKKPHPRTA